MKTIKPSDRFSLRDIAIFASWPSAASGGVAALITGLAILELDLLSVPEMTLLGVGLGRLYLSTTITMLLTPIINSLVLALVARGVSSVGAIVGRALVTGFFVGIVVTLALYYFSMSRLPN